MKSIEINMKDYVFKFFVILVMKLIKKYKIGQKEYWESNFEISLSIFSFSNWTIVSYSNIKIWDAGCTNEFV